MTDYAAICIDTPWHEPGGNGKGSNDHYDTIRSVEAMADAITTAKCWRPAPHSHCYLWTTMTSLLLGTRLLAALKFRYRSHAIWVKTNKHGQPLKGVGQYFRGSHEVVLFGTRGRGFACRSAARDIPSVFFAPPPRDANGKRIHSRKPNRFYELVERRTVGRKLDMFGRGAARPGWSIWGNEAEQQLEAA